MLLALMLFYCQNNLIDISTLLFPILSLLIDTPDSGPEADERASASETEDELLFVDTASCKEGIHPWHLYPFWRLILYH